MKRTLIKYSYIDKEGIELEAEFIADMDEPTDENEQKLEARRHFFEEHGFYACFDVVSLDVVSCIPY